MHPFERKSSSTGKVKGRHAKSKYGICAGFWFDRRGHKAKRSHGRFKQIYIASDEKPGQHVTVGLAEVRPNNLQFYGNGID